VSVSQSVSQSSNKSTSSFVYLCRVVCVGCIECTVCYNVVSITICLFVQCMLEMMLESFSQFELKSLTIQSRTVPIVGSNALMSFFFLSTTGSTTVVNSFLLIADR